VIVIKKKWGSNQTSNSSMEY